MVIRFESYNNNYQNWTSTCDSNLAIWKELKTRLNKKHVIWVETANNWFEVLVGNYSIGKLFIEKQLEE